MGRKKQASRRRFRHEPGCGREVQHITTAIVTLDGADGVAVATRDGHQLFECHPRHCGFRRELPPATVEALVAQARRDGLPYTPIS